MLVAAGIKDSAHIIPIKQSKAWSRNVSTIHNQHRRLSKHMPTDPKKAKEIARNALREYEAKYPDEPQPEPEDVMPYEEFCEQFLGYSPTNPELEKKIGRAQYKVACQLSYEAYSPSPLHQERARKNPNYWKTIGYMGCYNEAVMNAVAEIITEEEQLKQQDTQSD